MANYSSSVRHLKRVDPVLARVIESVGPCRIRISEDPSHFHALTRSIVFQQLSGKAASTILSRVHALYPNNVPTPDAVLSTKDEPCAPPASRGRRSAI